MCSDMSSNLLKARLTNGTWSENSLKLAVKSVLVDGMFKKRSAAMHGIPRQSLQNYLSRMTTEDDCGDEKRKNEPPTTLTSTQEE